MLIFARFVVSFFLFVWINLIECNNSVKVKCQFSSKARDQSYSMDNSTRHKRFVLFPEFQLWLNDWRYINRPKHFRYWISNYYPNEIDTNAVRSYINHIINVINQFIDHQIISVSEALSANQSNFNYNFFNYEICPSDDPTATTEGVENVETMLIYPAELVRKNRYRAHGGMSIASKNASPISQIKFNIHHDFAITNDLQYEPVRYSCTVDESNCKMDLYATMLHETLHGFGIEHTEGNLTKGSIPAVMHLFASRIMCHDDIRAIRMVYRLAVKRENINYDDTCRRDFPMNKLQKIMFQINRLIEFYLFRIGSFISLLIFLITMIYILFKRSCLHGENHSRYSIQSVASEQSHQKMHKSAINAFLWHDDLI